MEDESTRRHKVGPHCSFRPKKKKNVQRASKVILHLFLQPFLAVKTMPVVGSTLDRIWCSRGVQKGKVWVPILELLTFVLCETYLGFPAGSVVTIPPANSR